MRMETYVLVIIGSALSTIISVIITAFWFKKMRLELPSLLDTLAQTLGEGLREHVDKELEPAKVLISRAMSNKGTAGATTKQLKKADQLLGQDLMNLQAPEIQLILKTFPNLGEYVAENPHLLAQIMPRIQALMGDKDFKLTDLLGGGSPSPTQTRPHPLAGRE